MTKEICILCGGLGTRLRKTLADKPKALAPVGDTPFLDMLIQQVLKADFKRIILCTGYLSQHIQDHIRKKWSELDIVISCEPKPLGTGGALKLAARHLHSSDFFVMNGDSYCNINFSDMQHFHLNKNAAVTLAASKTDLDGSSGTIVFRKNGEITCFSEKTQGKGTGYMNAGIYLFSRESLNSFPEQDQFSLEYDFFPQLKNLFAFTTEETCFDIGTPEKLALFADIRNPLT